MSTLAALKSEIADDIIRSDLTSQIANAITAAIKHWQQTPYLFNDERVTFSTVASQSDYTSSDDADIGRLVKIHSSFESDGSNTSNLDRVGSDHMEYLLDGSAANGEPYQYSYFAEKIRLYPKPDKAYTIILNARTVAAAPATDVETGNPWMEEGYPLIRAWAKRELGLHITNDPELVSRMEIAAGQAQSFLEERYNRLNSTGYLEHTEF